MCVLNIFSRNLLQRVVKSGFLGEYFGELDTQVVKFYQPNEQIKKAKDWLQHYEIQSKMCDNEEGFQERLKNADKGSQKTEIFAHYDNAIRIDWNVWKEVKQYVDELIDKAAKMHKDKELSTFFQNEAKNAKKKFELVLTSEQTRTFKLMEYREHLNTIQHKCNEKINQYELELPYKINQNETYLKFNNFIAATVQKFGKKLIKKNGEEEKVVCDLDGANKLLDELYEFAITKIVKKSKSQEYACRQGQINFETGNQSDYGKNL
ncbi:hypothetical protein GPALN_004439 [Globodera pallida]|nr:hypothetical protein GPALN_004439 [Globodera pallida]